MTTIHFFDHLETFFMISFELLHLIFGGVGMYYELFVSSFDYQTSFFATLLSIRDNNHYNKYNSCQMILTQRWQWVNPFSGLLTTSKHISLLLSLRFLVYRYNRTQILKKNKLFNIYYSIFTILQTYITSQLKHINVDLVAQNVLW